MVRRLSQGLLRAWRNLRLRDAIIFTLPLVACVLYLYIGAVLNFRHLRQFGDWWGEQASMQATFGARIEAALRAPRAAALKRTLDPTATDPGIIRLEIDETAWATMSGDPLRGWGEWAQATLVTGNGRVSVDVRKRGDTSVHFTTEKTSFTLRMPRSSLLGGTREVGVSGKNVLSSWLANRLPLEFDVMAPRTALAPVFVNNRFYGMFRLIEPVDEGFLRHAGRMPGNVFRADAAERGEYRKGLERNVFWNAAAWERSAQVDSVPGVPIKASLVELLAALNGDTFERHREVMARVDRAQLARLVAAALVVGDPYHMSNVHNQYWYEDPTTGLLTPVPWDLRLTPLGSPPGRLNNFLRSAIRDPQLIDEVLRILAVKLAGDTLYRRAAEQVAEVWTQFGPHLKYDLLRRNAILDPGTPDEILTLLQANIDTLRQRIADSRIRVASGVEADGTVILDLETAGWAGSELTELRFSSPSPSVPRRLLADRDLDGRPSAGDQEIAVRTVVDDGGARLQLLQPLHLMSAWYAPSWGLQPGRVHYRLFLTGADAASPAAVTPVLRNPYNGAAATVLPWASETQGVDRGWNAWQYPERQPVSRQVLRGTVVLNQDLVVPAQGLLEIAPGTTLLLADGVSIISYGRVLARGTPAAPIRVLPAAAGIPWGSFILQGAGASGSVFEHITFREGSSARRDRVGYKGMVSVHHADSVVFRRARFERNLRSDDAVNFVHATVEVVDCDIVDANSDGLDFDYSAGQVRESRFLGPRGDAIDLMSSSPIVTANTIEGAGDKGISVGEDSHPLIVDNVIMNGNRGIEVKDASRPFIVHNVITGNQIGLLQNVKNWRYGRGGWAIVAFSQITANETDLLSDERSMATIVQSRIGNTPAPATTGASSPVAAAVVGEAPIPAQDGSIGPDWIYASLGLDAGDGVPGRLRTARSIRPAGPLYLEEFEEVLGGARHQWSPAGRVERITVQDAELVVAIEGRSGAVVRALDWDLTDGGRRYQAAVELGGTGIGSVRLRFMDGAVARAEATIPLRDEPGQRHLVTVDLPPAHYTQLRVDADTREEPPRVDPDTGLLEVWTGRLRIGRVQVHGWNTASETP